MLYAISWFNLTYKPKIASEIVKAFTAVELKSYNAILAPPICQKRLAAVEANLYILVDLLQCTSIYRCAL